ncbi:extracellular matrix/biofilm biosynthesis regulator RemA family protein, partial [uncultured Megamonas sp.]
GRRTRSVIIMDNSTVVLSAVQPETITNRVNMDIIKEKGRVNEE